MLRNLLLAGLGGGIGSALRYLMSDVTYRLIREPWLPWGTLLVNVLGCLVIGLLAGAAETRQIMRPETRVFVLIGILGGFTTFSTFGYETYALLRGGETLKMLANAGLQLGLGLAAVAAGYALSRLL